jgi:hypothetical protein
MTHSRTAAWQRKEFIMRLLIKLAIVLLICLIGIGFYRGWFSISSSNPDTQGEKVNINMSVDKNKMKSDLKKAEEKFKGKVDAIEGKAKAKPTETK